MNTAPLSTLPPSAQALFIFQTFCTLFSAHLDSYKIARLAYAFVLDEGKLFTATFEGDISLTYDSQDYKRTASGYLLRISWASIGARDLDDVLAYARRMETVAQIAKNFELALPFLKTASFDNDDVAFQLDGLAASIRDKMRGTIVPSRR